MGALLAGGYYKFVKYVNYEEANPGRDTINGPGKEREMIRKGCWEELMKGIEFCEQVSSVDRYSVHDLP
jgi:hypothetical protein